MVTLALWLKIALLVLPFIFLLRGDGLITSWLGDKTPDFVLEESEQHDNTALLVFAPTQVSADTWTRQHRKKWAKYRQVHAVDTSKIDWFDRNRVVQETFIHMQKSGVKELWLLGGSLGAGLAVDFIRYNRANGNRFIIKGVIPIDPVADQDDLFNAGGAKIFDVWYPGWVNSWVVGSWLVPLMHNPPEPEASVNQRLLDKHHQASRDFRLAVLGGQVRAVTSFVPPKPGEFAGIRMVLLRSEHDTVVKDSAVAPWLAGFSVDQETHVFSVNSAHCDLPAYPKAWAEAIDWALYQIGYIR